MEKLLQGTLIRMIHMKLGRETLIKQRFMGFFCTCALHHRRQKINGNFYLEVIGYSLGHLHLLSEYSIFLLNQSLFLKTRTSKDKSVLATTFVREKNQTTIN